MKYYLNKKEAKALKKHLKHHKDCPQISLAFTQTGIGVGITVRCEFCEQESNITDFSTW